MLRHLIVLAMFAATLLAAPTATATADASSAQPVTRQVPTVRVDLRVIGASGSIQGQQSGDCTDTTFIAGQSVKVRDARTGKKLAVGVVGQCDYEVDYNTVCMTGMGCITVVLSRPVYKLAVPRLPYVGVSKYAIKVGTYRFEIGPRKLYSEDWRHYFSA